MIRSAVTISLVEQARGGPFVFWDGLADGCAKAAEVGFDAVEIFAPAADAVNPDELRQLLDTHGLQCAAVGTGAGMVLHGLSLTDADAGKREHAKEFIRSIIDMGGPFGAPAIIGSMQGRWGGDVARDVAVQWVGEACVGLAAHAQQYDVPLIYEPINRYESNMFNAVVDAVEFVQGLATDNVRILADLFHMNIEDVCIADALRQGGNLIGHVHFVDSNRRPAGLGHMDYAPVVKALESIDYDGYLSVEAFPYPDPYEAAKQSILKFNELFRA